jgi:hypothetical protein
MCVLTVAGSGIDGAILVVVSWVKFISVTWSTDSIWPLSRVVTHARTALRLGFEMLRRGQ